jgi:IS30 family transposase
MKIKYTHLSEKDRIFLRIMLEKRYPKNKIASILGVDRSTIYREIKRNSCIHWYSGKKFYWMFKQGIKSNLITLRERKTRFIIAIKNLNKTASGTALTLISTMKNIKKYIKSITFDQGSEFNKYQRIKDCIDADIYFCKPASPYQKGAVENGNGVIRAELPREYDVTKLRQKDIANIIDEINNRPLKCLDYKTPQEIFTKYVNQAGNTSLGIQ